VELGSNVDAGHLLSVDASSFARGTGGIHGILEEYIFLPETEEEEEDEAAGGDTHEHEHLHPFIIHPTLPLASRHGVSSDATKITYISPRFSGFQVGGSFIPDSGNVGSAAGFTTDRDDAQYENVVNLAAQYGRE